MSPNAFLVQLPVSDLEKSRAFYAALGFQPTHSPPPPEDRKIALLGTNGKGGRKTFIALLTREYFSEFSRKPPADGNAGTAVIVTLGLESRAAVDELVEKAVAAGGAECGEAREFENIAYFRFFADPDGHQWEAHFMPGGLDGSGEKS